MKIVRDIKRHPIVAAAVVLLAAALLGIAFSEGTTWQMSAYLSAMLLGALVTDFLATKFEVGNPDFSIKSPSKELIFLLVVQAAIIFLSLARFQIFTDWQNTGFIIKLPMLILMILFIYPVALLAVFLKWKYSFRDLGFRLSGFWIGLPVILIIGATAFFTKPEKILFGVTYEEMGLISMILTGFIAAAIPEELTRVLMQTRLGKVSGNYAFGWLIASTVWALLHLPNFWAQSSQGFFPAAGAVLTILPIGLLWGFMTHRTRSIMPAVVVHGTNLWGLQNF